MGLEEFDEVSEFEYLGVIVSENEVMEAELKHKVEESAKTTRRLSAFWRNRRMTTDVKTGTLENLILFIVFYGSQPRVMKARERSMEDVLKNVPE